MFRSKVREKLKNAKINQSEKSSTHLLIDNKINQWSKRLVNDSYPKHLSLGDNLQDFAESHDKDYMEEVIFPDLLEVKAAEYEDDQEQIKRQQINIFVPSSSSVVNQRKLPKDMMPRILEDEGFYIQRKPKIYKKTCNKMENRLLQLEEASAPANKLNHSLIAVKSDLESSIRTKMEGQGKMYQLDLNIVGLQFSHHPVFNQEQVLCARLLQLYECFQDRQQQNLSQLLLEKYMKHKGKDIPKYFRLEQLQEESSFVSEEEMKKSKRFRLLQLRNAGQLGIFPLQQIPLYDREIPDSVFQRCISLAIGNKEEHAILLCNFFLYFGKKALVLLGTSILEVWFNIQQNSTPMAVYFDYSKESFWKQLLPKNLQGTQIQSIQPEEIIYSDTNKTMVDDLKNRHPDGGLGVELGTQTHGLDQKHQPETLRSSGPRSHYGATPTRGL
ncbi:hypothetical protein MDA_GLEAN10023465 [Myotis davidii]|uniref:Uncharacterized protein n=1 Tax=Myotis davidii TaxID=225400 RepID=L5MBE0_MYODS|nr:hypothetical protein MDA_GLEAN10023465 [Myotis davidii]